MREFESICLNAEQFVPEVEAKLEHLKGTTAEKVAEMIVDYKPRNDFKSKVQMKIVLKDDMPVYQRPRRLQLSDQLIVDNQVSEWLKQGIIQPSTSEYASPIVLAAKKDASKRLCYGYSVHGRYHNSLHGFDRRGKKVKDCVIKSREVWPTNKME